MMMKFQIQKDTTIGIHTAKPFLVHTKTVIREDLIYTGHILKHNFLLSMKISTTLVVKTGGTTIDR